MSEHDRIDKMVMALREGRVTRQEFEYEVCLILMGRR